MEFCLLKQGPATTLDISLEIGATQGAVRRTLHRMEAKGVVRRTNALATATYRQAWHLASMQVDDDPMLPLRRTWRSQQDWQAQPKHRVPRTSVFDNDSKE